MATPQIKLKRISLAEAVKIDAKIPEFKDRKHETREWFERRVKDRKEEDILLLGVYIANSQAGYLIAYDRYKDGSIYCWLAAVVPEFRREGILTLMMEYLETWAKEKGYKRIKIKTKNSRREMLFNLIKSDFMFTKVVEKEKMQDYKILLEKEL